MEDDSRYAGISSPRIDQLAEKAMGGNHLHWLWFNLLSIPFSCINLAIDQWHIRKSNAIIRVVAFSQIDHQGQAIYVNGRLQVWGDQ